MHKKEKKILLFLFTSLLAVVIFIPFIWMLSASLKNLTQLYAYPPKIIPKPPQWHNYVQAATSIPIFGAYGNSLKIAVITTAVQIMTAAMAGYAFAKLKFKGSGFIFMVFLATMMVPSQITMIPSFILFKKIGLLDTHLALILPAALFNAFGVFLLRQFFMGIPDSLQEAATIDGAGVPRIFISVYFPLIKPAISAYAIFTFMGSWNNFLYPLLFLNSPGKFTVPLVLSTFQGQYTTNWPVLMAACAMAVIPVLIVYVFGQKYMIEGIALSGLKS